MQVPTTFLAAVDSSVGGKTAIDLRAGKEHSRRVLSAASGALRCGYLRYSARKFLRTALPKR